MAGYWHLQIQSVVSTHLITHKSACAHNKKLIYGTSTKKQSHQNLEQRPSTEDALSTRELIIHKSITDRYLVLKTSIWGGTNVNVFWDQCFLKLNIPTHSFKKLGQEQNCSESTGKNITRRI